MSAEPAGVNRRVCERGPEPAPKLALLIPSSVRQHRANVGFGDGYAVHLGVAVKPPHRLAPADAAHVIFDGIAWQHRLAELAFVDGKKINPARLLGAFNPQDADYA